MTWRYYFSISMEAILLESILIPQVKEHPGGLSTVASTDEKKNIIHLDTSKPPLVCALSYAYELMNLYCRQQAEIIQRKANNHEITKEQYIDKMIHLDAEKACFRCKIFRDLEAPANDVAYNPEHMAIYDKNSQLNLSYQDIVTVFAQTILNRGKHPSSVSLKTHFANAYDFHAKNASRLRFYNKHNSTKEDEKSVENKTEIEEKNTFKK